MMRFLLMNILLFVASIASAQFKITGKVTSADSKKPIASASVFFSNTSKGSTTNEQGEFVLDNIPDGRYDLVVSCVSYETHVQNILPAKITAPLNIELKTKANELKEVVVGGYVKEGWQQWGKFFLDNFLGQSSYASQCIVKNTESIQFRNYKKQHLLKAFSDETLVIENRALGYTIRYKMELFQYDFNTRILLYQGYPLFEEMETKRSRKKERWSAARDKVYHGSELHFMRSIYRNKIADQGFEIRKLVKEPNLEKQRVKALYASSMIRKNVDGIMMVERAAWFKDSAKYYERIMQEPDEKEIVSPALLAADSIAYAVNSTTAGLDFTDYLRITYTKAIEDDDYLLQYRLNRKPMAPVSTLILINRKPIEILSNGFYAESLDLLHSGYWGWSEKMATMLPYDYWPAKK
jgi:hypothetical protein